MPVHAASDIRGRRIILEEELQKQKTELARVLVHELFHFAWARTSNENRQAYEAILRREMRLNAKGELGWSAERRKNQLDPGDVERRSRRWREYVCESFCDTAAWYFTPARHPEHTLKPRFRAWRAEWFRNFAPPGQRIPL